MPSLFPTAKSDPELLPFRPGLTFAFFNALAWQIGIGTPMVLFAEQLGATPFQVGLAYSFVFVLTPVQVVATALLPRFGFKALMLAGWRTRSFFLGIPAALALGAMLGLREASWMVQALVGSVFFFCLFRSIGAASGTSWFYAILPETVRGRYFASDQFVSAVAGVATLLVSAALFMFLPVYPALLAQYLIALAGSIFSYYALKQLPDAARPTSISVRTVLRDTPRHLFASSPFRNYVWLSVACAALATPIPPFAAYYLKVGPGLPTGQIMLFEVVRYGGVMVAAWLIRRRIDASGAKPFFCAALTIYAGVGAFWWLFLENGGHGAPAIFAVYFLLGLGAATWAIANLNYLPKIISADDRTLAVSIHGAVTACMGGTTPIVWGLFLKDRAAGAQSIDTEVFQYFFLSVTGGALVLAALFTRMPENQERNAEPVPMGEAALRPWQVATRGVIPGEALPGERRKPVSRSDMS